MLALLPVPRLVSESRMVRESHRIDFAGAATATGGLVAIVYGVLSAARHEGRRDNVVDDHASSALERRTAKAPGFTPSIGAAVLCLRASALGHSRRLPSRAPVTRARPLWAERQADGAQCAVHVSVPLWQPPSIG